MPELDPISHGYQLGLACQQAGRRDEAEQHFRAVLLHAPDHPDALHMLGRLLGERGHVAQGLELVQRAVRLQPGNPGYLNTFGKQLLKAGREADAERSFKDALRLAPGFAPAHVNLGRLYRRKGDAQGAEGHFRRATEINPKHAAGWNGLGGMLAARDADDEAERCFARMLEIDPRLAEAHYNLGALREKRGDRTLAKEAYEAALGLRADFVPARRALGKLLLSERRVSEALEFLESAVRSDPKSADAWMDLALARHATSDFAAAAQALRKALEVDSKHVAALLALGQILHHAQRRVGDAETCYRRALTVDPRSARAHLGLAELRQEEEPEEALPLFERALELDPALTGIGFSLARLRADVCDWRNRDQDMAALPAIVETLGAARLGAAPLPPFHLNSFPVAPELHQVAARLMSKQVDAVMADSRRRLAWPVRRSRGRKLRIGYLSPDFRGHVVGRLVRDLFRHHDRDEFEVFGYSLVDVQDQFRRDIERGLDRFRDVSASSPEAAARMIHQDGIDVLVDMGGYSTHTRAEIPALRPAPVQVHWLGYLDTMGAPFVPYVLADDIALPERVARHYDEAVVRLPDCFMASSRLDASDRTPDRRAVGLPASGFVFCCFNHPVKIGPEPFRLWMRILDRVPDSVLWLYDRGLRGVRENLRREARVAGVDPERLRFAGLVDEPEYLARYRLADLFLDTFHWNAGATAIGALRAGVPVITKPGETFLARMGASLCAVAGTPETVCGDDEVYVETAVSLATDPARLAAVRAKLGDALVNTPLFELPRFTRHLEEAYRRMWAQHAAGDAPSSIRIPRG